MRPSCLGQSNLGAVVVKQGNACMRAHQSAMRGSLSTASWSGVIAT